MHLSINHSLCSAVHNYDSLCRRSSRSPIMLSILLVIGRAGASPPSRTTSMTFLYIYPCRTSCPKSSTCFFSPIFQYFSAVNVTRVSFSPVFQYFVSYVCNAPLNCIHLEFIRHGFASHRCRCCCTFR